MPYRCRRPSGRSIVIFFYDGPISRAVAFEQLLARGENLAHRLLGAFSDTREAPQLVNIATDGETYGHHHKFGEMALARALEELRLRGIRVENFGSFLARNPAVDDVELVAPTSWSCAHGVGRWKENCGCRVDGRKYASQEWRAPLREGLDALAASLHEVFEREAIQFIPDPWDARDQYGTVVASDAIALAVRVEAKIFATDEVIEESAIEFEGDDEENERRIARVSGLADLDPDEFRRCLHSVTAEDFAKAVGEAEPEARD